MEKESGRQEKGRWARNFGFAAIVIDLFIKRLDILIAGATLAFGGIIFERIGKKKA